MSARALAMSAGALQRASDLTEFTDSTDLPVTGELAKLLPWPRLRRGATVAVATDIAVGGASLVLTLLSKASQAGAWCALVGDPTMSAAAAAQLGIALSRLAFVPDAGGQWASVTAALLDGIDIVALHASAAITPKNAQRLAARARKRGALLIPFGPGAASWPGADVTLSIERARWHGLRAGRGLLRHCELEVDSRFRGQNRRATVWPYGRPTPIDPPVDSIESAVLAPVISLSDHRRRQEVGKPSARTRRAMP